MPQGKFLRSSNDRKLGGVCGGLAAYLQVDPLLVRVLWVVGTLVSMGIGILAYVLLWVLADEAPAPTAWTKVDTPPSPPAQ